MTAEEFKIKVTSLIPSQEDFSKLGYSTNLIDSFRNMYYLERKFANTSDNPILDLVQNFDVSKLRICDITFDDKFDQYGDEVFFGWDISGDRLGFSLLNGVVFTFDVYGDSVTFQCADSPAKFLDALIVVMSHQSDIITNNYSDEVKELKSKKAAHEAALSAGGVRYEPYFKSVIYVGD